MKNIVNSLTLICFTILCLTLSCQKEEVPAVTTSAIENITGDAASGGGTITNEGTNSVFERGVCWSTGDPSILDSKTVDGKGSGSFTSNLSNLNPATLYWVRAYATNNAGTGYGTAISFMTMGQAPVATTQSATHVTDITATLNGLVNPNYLSTTITFEYGTTTSYGQTITASPGILTGSSGSIVTAGLSGLLPGTTYHFRVKTVNSLGTTNGNDLSFTTLGQAPTTGTLYACCLSATSAKLNGVVNANYLSTTVSFEYGLTTAYGNLVQAIPNMVTGSTNTSVIAFISGLVTHTTYHFRIKAANFMGTTYSGDMTFTTL